MSLKVRDRCFFNAMKFINKVLIIRLDDTNHRQNLHGRLLRHDQISDSLIQIRNQRIEIGYFLERSRVISDTLLASQPAAAAAKTDLACGNVDAKKVMFFTTSSNICCNAPLLAARLRCVIDTSDTSASICSRVESNCAAKFFTPCANFI